MSASTMDFTRRDAAIDILRALTMLLMIFVNDLWTISGYPGWLGHAGRGQDMLGLADMVFPCFLFAVGTSIPFAIERRFSKGLSGVSTVGHILSRTFALLLMGAFIVNTEHGVSPKTGMSLGVFRIVMTIAFLLIWNVYPKAGNRNMKRLYRILKIVGILLLVWLAIVFRDAGGGVFQARWWGILGLIGWTYLVCAFIYLFTRDRFRYLIPIWIIFVLICILKSGTIEGPPLLNLPRGNFLDEWLSMLHIDNGALPAFTMGGMLLSLAGVKYAGISNRTKIIVVAGVACILLIAGVLSHNVWIISKLSATPPWVFFCTAIAAGTYGVIYWLVEAGKASWFTIISPAGTATLTCYLLPYIMYSLVAITGVKLPEWLTIGVAGVLNCIAYSFIIIGITRLLGKIHIKLKI
ncbi:MAG: DUF5009 domain-containing protein [Tannerellaceae bacterium]|jgi:hypothetical protein|nr:DUF5009 domain-containing protein [Tannerellaceae bacterium]